MRFPTVRALRIAAVGVALVACNSDRIAGPSASVTPAVPRQAAFTQLAVMPSVRISEFHYNHPGTDVAGTEKIEISGPEGTNLAGWTLVRYNGSTPSAAVIYTSPTFATLTGTIAQSCGTRGVLTFSSASQDGLQNGGNDGFALVNPSGQIVELLSYQGVFTVSSSAAVGAGLTSTDVGVSETPASTDAPTSIQRQPDGTWIKSTTTTFGTCNDDDSGGGVVTPVVDHITVLPLTATITQGATQSFSATAYDAANQPIAGTTFTWGTSNSAAATVNASGLATGVGPGSANITATSGSIVGTATLTVNAAVVYTPPNVRVSEIHYDNAGTDAGEAIEVEGPVGTSLAGWSIALYNGDPTSSTTPLKVYHTIALSGALAAPVACNSRGALTFAVPASPGFQNGGTAGAQPDGLALVDNNGALVEFLSYEGSFTAADGPAIGVTSRNIGVMEDNPVPAASPLTSLQRSADGTTWSGPAANSFDYVNACGAPPPPQFTIQFSGRATPADPPLPVGFEAQIFASEKEGTATINTTITWSSETPAIATIDQNGVFRALSAGTAVFRATATDGTTATYALPTVVGTQSAAPYGGNTEFGDPVDGDPSNDFIIRRLEYTSSFNKALGRPNWVSAKLDATTYGAEDRCNCFTFDPELVAAGFTPYTTADYTGAGAFAGYGIDRGHLTRSADRTAGNLDNARTYYFSNVLPQAAANNQGTWKLLEDTLGAVAETQGKEVYTIMGGSNGTGALASKGFIKGQNKIEMPGAVWKVAVIMDHGKGLADVKRASDLQIIAVIMPNDPSINSDWHVYRTTVDAVEALSGYDLLSLLPDNIEKAVESGDAQPVARLTGPTTGNEGSSLAFDASTSTDADVGDALTYAWTFGDGSTATGASPSHTFADNGTYAVTVTATDSHGVYDTATLSVTVANVAPTATFSRPAGPLVEGTGFTLSLSGASDASSVDQTTLTYAFDCGDGAGYHTASASASLGCTASDDPSAAVKAKVIDKDGGSTEYTASITVTNAAPVITSYTVTPGLSAAGATVTATVTFTDAGPADAHTAIINWGDGTSSTVNCGLALQAVATHVYAGAGFYTVGATLSDDDGATANASAAIIVTAPAAGYLQGTGMVQGIVRANYALDIRYEGGATPTGSFLMGSAPTMKNLTATSFDYLVIAGDYATFAGSGTLADGTPVRFFVRGQDLKSASPGASDLIRIKVAHATTGVVLFDTQPGAEELAAPTTIVRLGSFNQQGSPGILPGTYSIKH